MDEKMFINKRVDDHRPKTLNVSSLKKAIV